MAQTYTDTSGIIHIVETPERKVASLLNDACYGKSVVIMQQALALASEHDAEIDIEQLKNRALRRVIEAGSVSLLLYILSQGADVKAVPPTTIAWSWWKEVDVEKKQEACIQTTKIIGILLDHGWDINMMQSAEYETTPLLWYVCGSQSLVRYCLDRGAYLIITEEQTSSNPKDINADIYYTERHLLLLECAAAHSDIETFELLKDRQAPLVPGKTWPPWHAPCLLLRAVQQAAELAPNLQADAKPAYLGRISMVKHLLSTIGLPSHESDPRTWKIVDSDLAPPEKDYWSDDEVEVRDLRELVTLLLTAHPSPEAFMQLDVDSHVFETGVTSLDFLNRTMPIPFQLAFKHWQRCHKGAGSPKALYSSTQTPQAAGVSESVLGADKFSRLPSEVINLIALCLKPSDVLSFRGVNRKVRNASFAAFKTLIRCRKLSLTSSALERLHEELVSDSHLFWHVEEVVFQAKDNRNRVAGESRQIQDLLALYFINSKTKGNLHGLVLQNGYDALTCVLPALQSSRLPLHKLSLFPQGGHSTASIDDFRNFAGMKEISSTLSSVQHFTWTLSTSYGLIDGSISGKNIATIKQIFGMMPMLKILDLGWYRRYPKKSEVEFLDSCLDNLLTMTHLKEIRLRGISASPSTLRTLVAQTTATRISLTRITFNHEDTFRPILDVLTGGRFDYFHLNELRAHKRTNGLIRFIVPGPTRFASESHCLGPFEIVRQGNEVRRHIDFHVDTGRILSSGAWKRYSMRSDEMYGQHDHMD